MALTHSKTYKGALLKFEVDGEEYQTETVSVALVSEDAETVMFGGNTKDWFMDVEAKGEYADGSFWEFVWSNENVADIAFTVNPYGSATPSPTAPHFTGTLTVPEGAASVGGSASDNWTFEVRFELDGKPVRETA